MRGSCKNWTVEELQAIHDLPVLELIARAHAVHSRHHDRQEMQMCTLINIKMGGCAEDCRYCAQSSRYQTSISVQPLMKLEPVLAKAQAAKERGATRICLGVAWREVRDGPVFDQILQLVEEIAKLGLEVCCSMGMLTQPQAERLKRAGLYAYSHNLNSGEKFFKTMVSTHTYQDRLKTLDILEEVGVSVCCGGILGMGESIMDRLEMLLDLSRRDPHPESVPINRLVPIPGTPYAERPPTSIWEMVRMIGTTRIVLPRAMVRLSCGRLQMSYEQQALCFLAGANSIHSGEKLLTLPNISFDQDAAMFELFGLKPRPGFVKPC